MAYKVRIVKDLFVRLAASGDEGGFNGDTEPDTVRQCLCVHALAKFLDELVTRTKKFPVERILTSKAHVADAFRNVRVEPDQARNVCSPVGDLVVNNFRLTFEWSRSTGSWGVMSATVEHAHCNTTVNVTQLLLRGTIVNRTKYCY